MAIIQKVVIQCPCQLKQEEIFNFIACSREIADEQFISWVQRSKVAEFFESLRLLIQSVGRSAPHDGE